MYALNAPKNQPAASNVVNWGHPSTEGMSSHLNSFLQASAGYFNLSKDEQEQLNAEQKTQRVLEFVEATHHYLEDNAESSGTSKFLEWLGLGVSVGAYGVGVSDPSYNFQLQDIVPYAVGCFPALVAGNKVSISKDDLREFEAIRSEIYSIYNGDRPADEKLELILQGLHSIGYDEDNRNLFESFDEAAASKNSQFKGRKIKTKLTVQGVMSTYNPDSRQKKNKFTQLCIGAKDAVKASVDSIMHLQSWAKAVVLDGPKAAVKLTPTWCRLALNSVRNSARHRYAEKGQPAAVKIPSIFVYKEDGMTGAHRRLTHAKESLYLSLASHCDLVLLTNEVISLQSSLAEGQFFKASLHAVSSFLSFQPPEAFSKEVEHASIELCEDRLTSEVKASRLREKARFALTANPSRVQARNDNASPEVPSGQITEQIDLPGMG